MENQENVALLKEQIRAKDRELRQQEAAQAKNNARIRQVLSLSEKKIMFLKEVVSVQDQKIKTAKKETPFSKDKADADKKNEAQSENTDIPKDPNLLKEIKALKVKNKKLSEQTKIEETERKKWEREKSTLTKEFRKFEDLRKAGTAAQLKPSVKSPGKTERIFKGKNQPGRGQEDITPEELLPLDEFIKIRDHTDEIENLKKKIDEQERKIRQSLRKSEKIAREKTEIIKKYQKMLYRENEEGVQKVRLLPSEIIGELKEQLADIIQEKERLQVELDRERTFFEKKSKKEHEQLQEELDKQKKRDSPRKSHSTDFANEFEDDGIPPWMVTFADMVTLLFVFFVIFYSIVSMNMQTITEALMSEKDASVDVMEILDSLEVKKSIQELTGLASKDTILELDDSIENVASGRTKIILRVPGSSLFESGKASLVKESRKILENIVEVAKQHPRYKINIQGHTDDIPVATERFPTNWELSAARATAVLRFFIDKGIEPKRLTATGYADIFPLFSNDTEQGRAKNRRVEFVLEKEKGIRKS